MLLSTSQLDQFSIGASDGDIGRVRDVYFDDRHWTVRYFVVHTGGWLRGREVLISPVQIRRADTTRGILHASLTRAQVEGSPPVDAKKPVSRQEEAAHSSYYGFAPYWAGPNRWGPVADPWLVPRMGDPVGPQPSRPEEEILARERSQQDPHLRSAREVRGYGLEARDGSIGHVEDFLVDPRSWAIRWVIVDTQSWWPGKHVLVSPRWVQRVRWDASAVSVDLPRDQIRSAPAYDPNLPVDRDLESRLAAHYGRRGYWEEEERAASERAAGT
ncbi:MAG: PRC-barrel domain-containing protein [Candidatus Methylomirabilales bacterium]